MISADSFNKDLSIWFKYMYIILKVKYIQATCTTACSNKALGIGYIESIWKNKDEIH